MFLYYSVVLLVFGTEVVFHLKVTHEAVQARTGAMAEAKETLVLSFLVALEELWLLPGSFVRQTLAVQGREPPYYTSAHGCNGALGIADHVQSNEHRSHKVHQIISNRSFQGGQFTV